jgi:hypothetical protein
MLILEDVVAITSRNAGTVRTRTVGSSLYNMAVQTSNIISTQVRTSPLSSETNVCSTPIVQLLIYFIQCRSIRIKINRSITLATRSSWVLQVTMLSCLLEPSFTILGRISTFAFDANLKFCQVLILVLANETRFGILWPEMKKSITSLRLKIRGTNGMFLPFIIWTPFHRPLLTPISLVLTSASPLDR